MAAPPQPCTDSISITILGVLRQSITLSAVRFFPINATHGTWRCRGQGPGTLSALPKLSTAFASHDTHLKFVLLRCAQSNYGNSARRV